MKRIVLIFLISAVLILSGCNQGSATSTGTKTVKTTSAPLDNAISSQFIANTSRVKRTWNGKLGVYRLKMQKQSENKSGNEGLKGSFLVNFFDY